MEPLLYLPTAVHEVADTQDTDDKTGISPSMLGSELKAQTPPFPVITDEY